MRDALLPYLGQRLAVEATVIRHGTRTVWHDVRVPTICLGPITTPAGEALCGHCWFALGKRLGALAPRPGDRLRFTARVVPYRKGSYRGADGSMTYHTDYQLAYPARVELLARAAERARPVAPSALVVPDDASPRDRVLAALAQCAGAEPISPTWLITALRLAPLRAIKLLRECARKGLVTFTPDGSLCVPPVASIERSA